MDAVLLASPRRAVLVQRVEFHDPPAELGVRFVLYVEAKPCPANPIDAGLFAGLKRLELAGQIAAFAQDVMNRTRHTTADLDPRDHKPRTRSMAAFNCWMVSRSSRSSRSMPTALACLAS